MVGIAIQDVENVEAGGPIPMNVFGSVVDSPIISRRKFIDPVGLVAKVEVVGRQKTLYVRVGQSVGDNRAGAHHSNQRGSTRFENTGQFVQPEKLCFFCQVGEDRVADNKVEAGVLKRKRFPRIDKGEARAGEIFRTPLHIVGINVDAIDCSRSVSSQVPRQSSTAAAPIQNRRGVGNVHREVRFQDRTELVDKSPAGKIEPLIILLIQ